MGISLLVGLVLSFIPLFNVPGPESALVLGIILPPFVCLWGFRTALDSPPRTLSQETTLLFSLSLGVFLFVLGCGLVLEARDFGSVSCDPWTGRAHLLLGPGMGGIAAATLGRTMGSIPWIANKRGASVVAFSIPILFIAGSLWQLYASPGIYSLGLFYGWLTGAIYDTDTSIEPRYIYFRLQSLVFILGCSFWLLSKVISKKHRMRALSLLFLMGYIAACLVGDRFNFHSSKDEIIRNLGASLTSKRCVLYVPSEMPLHMRKRHAQECDFKVSNIESQLQLSPPTGPVTVYLFRSIEEKKRLMGAAGTDIAKPWRKEIYLHDEGFPHDVMMHELAHAVLADVGSGPFKIAGWLGGLIPKSGIIEGLAVALAWDETRGFTPHEWSHAMLEMKLLPELESIQSGGFLTESADRAYTANGSFMKWILEVHGPDAMKKIYRTGSLSFLGEVPALEKKWHADLRTQPLSQEAKARVALYFKQPSVFAQVCPHTIASEYATIMDELGKGKIKEARLRCERIVALDPGSVEHRVNHLRLLIEEGDLQEAKHQFATLASKGFSPLAMMGVEELFADLAFSAGDLPVAKEHYDRLLSLTLDEHTRRQIEVKRFALSTLLQHPESIEAKAVRDLLIGAKQRLSPSHGPATGPVLNMHRIYSMRTEDPWYAFSLYLEARQLVMAHHYNEAHPLLEDAIRLGVLNGAACQEALMTEARKLLITSWVFADKDPLLLGKAKALASLMHDQSPSGTDKVFFTEMMARAEYYANN